MLKTEYSLFFYVFEHFVSDFFQCNFWWIYTIFRSEDREKIGLVDVKRSSQTAISVLSYEEKTDEVNE